MTNIRDECHFSASPAERGDDPADAASVGRDELHRDVLSEEAALAVGVGFDLPVYREKLRAAVREAQANYENNKLNFLDLATAQRQLVNILERQQKAIVALHRRLAELDRVVAVPALRAAQPPASP